VEDRRLFLRCARSPVSIMANDEFGASVRLRDEEGHLDIFDGD
jgi:hypothetical protein